MNNLLTDPIIRVDDQRLDLPRLIVRLIGDQVGTYPGMRAHQEDAFHAALVQLSAYALHASGTTTIPKTAAKWRQILAGLTPHKFAWCLIAPHQEPAFFQPPAKSLTGWTACDSPALIDAVRGSKEIDVKRGPASAQPDQWMFTLITLQTTTPYDGPHYASTSRMANGTSSRLFVSLNGSPGQRFLRDLRVLLANRNRILDTSRGYAKSGGLALTWLAPYGSPIAKAKLDPLYLDTPRQVRLTADGALVYPSQKLRTLGKVAALGGWTGDPWAPTTSDGTLTRKDLTFRTVAPIIVGAGVTWSLLQEIRPDDPDPVELRLSVLTGGKPAQTDGFHTRIVPIPGDARSQLRDIAEMAVQRINALEVVQKAIFAANWAGYEKYHGAKKKKKLTYSARQRMLGSQARAIIDRWFAEEDRRFFDDLWREAGVADESAERRQWLHRVLYDGLTTVQYACKMVFGNHRYRIALPQMEIVFYRATAKLRVKSDE